VFDERQQVVVLITSDRRAPAKAFAEEATSFKCRAANRQIRPGADRTVPNSREPIRIRTTKTHGIAGGIELRERDEKSGWLATKSEHRPYSGADRRIRESAHECVQPTRIDPRIIVRKCNNPPPRMLYA
jgi:hypothetical protein